MLSAACCHRLGDGRGVALGIQYCFSCFFDDMKLKTDTVSAHLIFGVYEGASFM